MKKNIVMVLIAVFLMLNALFAMTDVVKEPAELPVEGTIAADFLLEDLNANQVALLSFRDKKSVVLFFWASWCPFCRKEIENLEKEYPTLKKKNIEILAVDIGETKSRVASFLKRYPVSFSVLLDYDMSVAQIYEVMGVPTYIMVDTKAVIKYRGNRLPEDYLKLIK